MQDSKDTELKVGDFNVRSRTPAARLYGAALLEAARQDSRIVCLTADLTLPTETDLIRDELPDRFIQVGIAEANMIGIAGGMARSGDIPFVHSFCVFATRRCYDQIAMQVAYPRLPVKIVGVIPGLSTMLGISHQATDDIALMRSLPNMTVIEPSEPGQLPFAVQAALDVNGPVYLRLKRAEGSQSTGEARSLIPCKMDVRREGKHGLLVACGMMVPIAIEASDRLAQEGLRVGVVEMATVKPIDPALLDLARKAPVIVTAENHSIIGGLGSAVAELLAESDVKVRFDRVGVRDTFAEGGTTKFLFERYGLDAAHLAERFTRLHARQPKY
jgi:transketolase